MDEIDVVVAVLRMRFATIDNLIKATESLVKRNEQLTERIKKLEALNKKP